MALELRHCRRHRSVCKQGHQRQRQDFDQEFVSVERYKATELVNEFPSKRWTKRNINRLMKQLRETGVVNRFTSNGRRRNARIEENVNLKTSVYFNVAAKKLD